MDRRLFLQRTLLAGGLTMAAPLEALARRLANREARPEDGIGYGSLVAVNDETTGLPLLKLPKGFRYSTFGWTGDLLSTGMRTPAQHDGMATFAGPGDRVFLIRNHEVTDGPSFDPSISYDPAGGGGTTTLEFDAKAGRWVGGRSSLAGTVRNCAGGPTPWGSWLTCEETLFEPSSRQSFTRKHGYVFEVPLTGKPTCEPLIAMGRFVHEAVAVDPATGIVYETQDTSQAGLYRFIPSTPGDLAKGGRLEMLAVSGRPRYDTRTRQRTGETHQVSWVPIDDPDRAHDRLGGDDGRGVFAQGLRNGGATFARLEGAWYGAGKAFFTSTIGGDAKVGQVWELDPAATSLRLVFESRGDGTLNMPDNLCVSPRGGLVICEDGTANPSVHGLTLDGRIFRFARNNVVLHGERNGIRGDFRDSEFAGATFSPDGRWLFFNVQHPGFTAAVTGPWQDGGI